MPVKSPFPLAVPPLSRRRLLLGAGAAASVSLLPFPLQVLAASKAIKVTEAAHLGMYISLYAAKHGGFFEKNGLDVSVSSAGGLALAIPVVLSGNAAFAVTGAGMAVNANREGASLVNVAKIVGGVAMWAVAKPGVKINSMADLKGKTIATLRYPSSTMQIPIFAMKRAGIDPQAAGVKFLQLPPGAQAQAVVDGRADVATMFEWDVSISKAQFGLEPVYSFNDVVGPLAWTTTMVQRSTIESDPQTVQAFCNAIAQAQVALHGDLELFIKTAVAEFPQASEAIIRAGAANMMRTTVVPKNPVITKSEWDTDMALELDGGSIKAALPFEQMVDNRFAEKAAALAAKG